MIDLGPFGTLSMGLLYVVLLLVASVLCIARGIRVDSRYWWFPVVFAANFFAFRAVDQGGFIGDQIIAQADGANIVPYIASLMGLVDTLTAVALLILCGGLLLSRVVVGLLALAVLLAYFPAAMGWISGDMGIVIANVIGIIQMAAIIGDASGGLGRLANRDNRIGVVIRGGAALVARAAVMAPIPPRAAP